MIISVSKIDQVGTRGGYEAYSPECVEALSERLDALEKPAEEGVEAPAEEDGEE